ncbi:hypothetical protein Nhal_1326 [Nitrosococcus halophilus Nc 4]|uniref:Uncharacterized protein n=1 Tax=Nitrosococcus halophilus (strain Nc4) TaxID=472759 RepID=D5C0F2_NITHN|nr:hypothetical protein [Nitrosococcus halophilus]ADE14478.1 hypothetical protein Nhal_1326 [Nitrosococcus halophilus Nc 4]
MSNGWLNKDRFLLKGGRDNFFSNLLTLIFLALLSSLSVGWVTLPAAGNMEYFNLIAIIFVCVSFFLGRGRLISSSIVVVRSNISLVLSVTLYILILTATIVINFYPLYTPITVMRIASYGIFALIVAAFVAGNRLTMSSIARWAPLFLLLLYVSFMLMASREGGISLVEPIRATLQSGDLNHITYGIFYRLANMTSAEDAEFGRSIRHITSSAIFVTVTLSVYFSSYRLGSRSKSFLHLFAIISSLLLIFIISSRGVILALILWGILVLPKFLRRKKNLIRMSLLIPPTIIIAIVGFFPFIQAIYNKYFLQTESYSGRLSGILDAFNRIEDNWLIGAEFPNRILSAHNIIIDSWQGAGLLGLLAAVTLMIALALSLRKMLKLLYRQPRVDLRIAAVVGFLILPAVRFLVAGWGLLNLAEWISLGLACGFMCKLTCTGVYSSSHKLIAINSLQSPQSFNVSSSASGNG